MPRKSVDVKSDYRILNVVRKPGDNKELYIVEDEDLKPTDQVVGIALYLYSVIMSIQVLRSAVQQNTLEQKIYVKGKRLSGERADIVMVDELDKEKLRNSH